MNCGHLRQELVLDGATVALPCATCRAKYPAARGRSVVVDGGWLAHLGRRGPREDVELLHVQLALPREVLPLAGDSGKGLWAWSRKP